MGGVFEKPRASRKQRTAPVRYRWWRHPRDGAGLLQGLLLCGQCSARLNIAYAGQGGRYPSYFCRALRRDVIAKACLNVSSRNVDGPVVSLVLQTLTRQNLNDAMQVVALVEQEDVALDQQWKLRIERARYETKRAEKQYNLCDPENRIVVRTLEARWNEKLEELGRLEHEYEELSRRKRVELSDIDRKRILDLADDIPKLWKAKSRQPKQSFPYVTSSTAGDHDTIHRCASQYSALGCPMADRRGHRNRGRSHDETASTRPTQTEPRLAVALDDRSQFPVEVETPRPSLTATCGPGGAL